MSTWNYRVLRYPNGAVGIHEVYYSADGMLCTVDAVGVVGNDPDDLGRELAHMLEALLLPVLNYEDF